MWTIEPPKTPGVYWHRHASNDKPQIVEVALEGQDLIAHFPGIDEHYSKDVQDMCGQWQGPITWRDK